jgi:two-component system response regulator
MNDPEIVELLLVEDNPHDAELTIRALKKRNLTNALFITEDGAEALDFIFAQGKYSQRDMTNTPKVILLDLKLPKISGLEVLKILKNHPQTRAIPVVVVTSSAETPDIKAAYDLGVNSYVVKPVDFDQFSESMSNLGFYWLLVNQPPK